MDIDEGVALVSLAEVKEYLNISVDDEEQDEILGALINACSSWVSGHIGRPLVRAERTEYYSGDGSRDLLLRVTPITEVDSIHVDNNRQFSALYLVDDSDYFISPKNGLLTSFNLLGNWVEGKANIKVVYTAGYDISKDNEAEGGLPQAIRLAVNRLIDKQYRAGYTHRKLDIASETVGDRTTTFRENDVPKDVISLLAPFRGRIANPMFEFEEE